MIAKEADYIAMCIVMGLLIEEAYTIDEGIGITCQTNHSVRNIEKYPRYQENIMKLNKDLKKFVEEQ